MRREAVDCDAYRNLECRLVLQEVYLLDLLRRFQKSFQIVYQVNVCTFFVAQKILTMAVAKIFVAEACVVASTMLEPEGEAEDENPEFPDAADVPRIS